MLICLYIVISLVYTEVVMIRLNGFELRPETERVVELQYNRLLERYGPRGETPKAYHNATHAINVARAAARMAIAMNKPEGFINDIVVAGMFHDDEQSYGPGENERRSAENAVAVLTDLRDRREDGYNFAYFTGKHRKRIYDAIMATDIDHDTFEQSAECDAGRILADADLASLGADPQIYDVFRNKLFREFHPNESKMGPAMHRFLGKSIVLLENHRYYTEVAEKMLPHQQENLMATRALQRHIGRELGL